MRTCLSEVMQVPDLGAVAAGADSPPVALQFFRRAWVVGVTVVSIGVDRDTGIARGSLALAIEDAGQRAITLDGVTRARTFAPFSLLSPGIGQGIGEATFPLVLPVEEDDTWTFQVHNYHGATTFTPAVAVLLAPNPPGSPRPSPLCSSLDACSRIILTQTPQLAAGAASEWVSMNYPEAGRITGVRAVSLRDDVARSNIALEMYDPECRETPTSDGRTSVPVSTALLAPGFEQTMPLDIPRAANKRYRFRAQNTSTTNATPVIATLWDGPFLRK